MGGKLLFLQRIGAINLYYKHRSSFFEEIVLPYDEDTSLDTLEKVSRSV